MLIKREDIIVDREWNYRRVLRDVEELAASIKSEGLKQGPCVSPIGNGKYTVTAGFRRMAALDLLGWSEVDCTIDNSTDLVGRRITNLIENVQRVGTSFGEEADAIKILLINGLTEQAIGDRLGKSRNWVQERNYYLQMPKRFQEEFDKGQMTAKELRSSYTIYKTLGEDRLYKVLGAYKDAKERGKVLDMAAIAKGGDRKGQRLIADQKNMQDHLINCLGVEHVTVKLLAWTLGAITDTEFDDYMEENVPDYIRREFP